MKVAIVGYGKMGKAIEKFIQNRGYEIIAKPNSFDELKACQNINEADVAIEFSHPDAAYDNINYLISQGVSVVSGTTGWLDRFRDIVRYANEQKVGFLYASNFSIGVNLFFELNKQLVEILGPYREYLPLIQEVHHTEKKDAPSGTAITLAQQINQIHPTVIKWTDDLDNKDTDTLTIASHRVDDVPGTHIVTYAGAIDEISINHVAKSRDGFAIGAVMAAEYLVGKVGLHTMQDVIDARK